MIIGHIGLAFAAKRRWESISLSVLLLATFAPDILRAPLAAAGMHWRDTNLYTHALPAGLIWAALIGVLAQRTLRDRTATCVVVALVVSHLGLDMISGRKPLWAHGPVGLDVEEFEQLELVIETLLLVAGWWLLRGTRTTPAWTRRPVVPVVLTVLEVVYLAGTMSQRPYRTRCLAAPIAECTDASLLTTKWNTTPFW